jgi:hypothetical protein
MVTTDCRLPARDEAARGVDGGAPAPPVAGRAEATESPDADVPEAFGWAPAAGVPSRPLSHSATWMPRKSFVHAKPVRADE